MLRLIDSTAFFELNRSIQFIIFSLLIGWIQPVFKHRGEREHMVMIGWNGTLLSEKDAVIPVWDHGFLYGLSLFETMRTYEGQPFRLEQHLNRLNEGCHALGIKLQLSAEDLRRHMAEVMQANGLQEAYIRLTVSAGDQGMGLPTGDYEHPIVMVLTKPLPPISSSLYHDGKPLQILKLTRNTPEGEVRFKSGHYMNNILAKRELMQHAPSKLGAEGLLLTEESDVAEGIVSNVFVVKEGKLYTPSLDTGILPGITRAVVIEIAKRIGVEVEERRFNAPWLIDSSDEIFITTSIQELVPITSVYDTTGDHTIIGNGTAGILTQRLLREYRRLTEHESWDKHDFIESSSKQV